MIILASRQKGVGLVEVLVSLLLLAIAVLGYTGLQTQAIKATDESFERSQSLVMMRNLAEKIRANPSAISVYEQRLNNEVSTPTKQCGLGGSAITSADLCLPNELAAAEVFKFKQELATYNFDIQIHPCPNTGGLGTDASNNIMFSYCMISAWGNTTATIGSSAEIDTEHATIDCLSDRQVDGETVIQAGGNYHPKATCMMMEL